VFGEEIHFLEAFVYREAAGAVADDHYVIGALHLRFLAGGPRFDAADAGYGAGAVGGAVLTLASSSDFTLFVG